MKLHIHNFWKDRDIRYIPLLNISIYRNRPDYKWSFDIGVFGICFSIRKERKPSNCCNLTPAQESAWQAMKQRANEYEAKVDAELRKLLNLNP